MTAGLTHLSHGGGDDTVLPPPPSRDKRLLALVEALIPTDDSPGATLANLDRDIESHWADCGAERLQARVGALDRLDAEARARTGRSFAELDGQEAAGLVGEVESGQTRVDWPEDCPAEEFIAEVIQLAYEGFYGRPARDGREPAGWALLGYQPGVT